MILPIHHNQPSIWWTIVPSIHYQSIQPPISTVHQIKVTEVTQTLLSASMVFALVRAVRSFAQNPNPPPCLRSPTSPSPLSISNPSPPSSPLAPNPTSHYDSTSSPSVRRAPSRRRRRRCRRRRRWRGGGAPPRRATARRRWRSSCGCSSAGPAWARSRSWRCSTSTWGWCAPSTASSSSRSSGSGTGGFSASRFDLVLVMLYESSD